METRWVKGGVRRWVETWRDEEMVDEETETPRDGEGGLDGWWDEEVEGRTAGWTDGQTGGWVDDGQPDAI